MLKTEVDRLELMRADPQVQNKRQADQAAVDLEAARESVLANQTTILGRPTKPSCRAKRR